MKLCKYGRPALMGFCLSVIPAMSFSQSAVTELAVAASQQSALDELHGAIKKAAAVGKTPAAVAATATKSAGGEKCKAADPVLQTILSPQKIGEKCGGWNDSCFEGCCYPLSCDWTGHCGA